MATISENQFPKVILEERATDGSDTANPAADHRALFLGEDGLLHLRDSSGTVTDVGGSGSSTASGARVYNNANIALNNGSLTFLTFNTERYDDATYHSTGSDTGRLTVPSAGRYLVGGHLQTTASSGDPSYVCIRVSGTTFIAIANIVQQGEVYTSIQTMWDCTAGTEYFELGVMVNAGSKNALTASAFSPEFWIERMGDT